MVLIPLLALAGAYLAGEAYERYATPQQKRKWENFARIHHGEAGILILGVGLVTKSSTIAASGIGLILHDRNDYKRWFTGNNTRTSGYL